MKKVLITLLLLMVVAGCAFSQNAQGCREMQMMFSRDASCQTGWAVLGITGHAPSCAEEQTMTELRGFCPDFE